MSIEPGTYTLGPQDGRLTVRTGRTGAAAKAGHDLVIEVQRWEATVQMAPDPAQSTLELTADARSLKVLEGSGGMQSLDEDDKAGISQTIDEEVLNGTSIRFRSTAVRPDGDGRFRITGDLELAGATNLIAFDLRIGDDGRLDAETAVTQSEWGMKPYSALFGTLKVADQVQVSIQARLQSR